MRASSPGIPKLRPSACAEINQCVGSTRQFQHNLISTQTSRPWVRGVVGVQERLGGGWWLPASGSFRGNSLPRSGSLRHVAVEKLDRGARAAAEGEPVSRRACAIDVPLPRVSRSVAVEAMIQRAHPAERGCCGPGPRCARRPRPWRSFNSRSCRSFNTPWPVC